MNETPKALRLHIGIFGRANVGKSSVLNLITGQDAAIVSPVAGTTTDVVRKSMELLPLGPVTFLDTAGVDDATALAGLRVARTNEALAASDVACLVVESGAWTEYEEDIARRCETQKTPVIVIVNKSDLVSPAADWLTGIRARHPRVIECSATRAGANASEREAFMRALKGHLLDAAPDGFLEPPAILGDLLPSGQGIPLAVLIVPIDLQAPKGRLILPQVQAIRDALDSDAAVTVVKEREYRAFLDRLSAPPDLVVCDSQIALKMVADTPPSIPATTFSILFSRFKGDIVRMAEGAAALATLSSGDRVLVAEACSHHALEDDIGRVKIPRWIRQFTGSGVEIDHVAGRDWPADLAKYRVVIHCGGCTLTRREMLARIETARASGVPVTNYGMAISVLQGVIDRTLSPFPAALEAYNRAKAAAAGNPANASERSAPSGHANTFPATGALAATQGASS
jgi:[FeFe] hydrogenase H-cluster maturation GTPase HydF